MCFDDMHLDDKIKDAICTNDLALLQEMVKSVGIDYVFKDEDGDSLLLYSISDPGSTVFKYLLDAGANISYKNRDGAGVLHNAVYSGDVDRILLLTGLYSSISIDERAGDGETPLLISALLGKLDIFKHLIGLGADVNAKDNSGNCPIHVAAYDGNIEMIRILIEMSADLNVKTKKGNKPLALAVNNGHDDIVRLLYEKIY